MIRFCFLVAMVSCETLLVNYQALVDYYSSFPQTAFSSFENELPVLILHGIGDQCETQKIWMLTQSIQALAQYQNKVLYAECLEIGSIFAFEVSIFANMQTQSKMYCELVQNHPVFGKSDFNIIGLSQGALIARSIIQDCDLGSFKVHNYLSVGGPQLGYHQLPGCTLPVVCDAVNWIIDKVAYTPLFQQIISAADYLRLTDSNFDQSLYKKKSMFLTFINNEIDHPKSE